MIIPGRNDGYPCIPELPDLPQDAGMIPPLPDMYFRCTDGVNDGYPAILSVSEPDIFLSDFISGGCPTGVLYFGNAPVNAAFFGEKCVYTRW